MPTTWTFHDLYLDALELGWGSDAPGDPVGERLIYDGEEVNYRRGRNTWELAGQGGPSSPASSHGRAQPRGHQTPHSTTSNVPRSHAHDTAHTAPGNPSPSREASDQQVPGVGAPQRPQQSEDPDLQAGQGRHPPTNTRHLADDYLQDSGVSSYDSEAFVDLEDSAEEFDDIMLPSNHARRVRTNHVDLTDDGPLATTSRPCESRVRKRSADVTTAGASTERASKRSRKEPENVEELDLVDENPSAEEELQATVQQQAIQAQQEDERTGPLRIGSRQCIICMENYTNCTATSCGHFYCHECLVRALIAGARNGDRSTGTCPVCRKPLSHTAKKKHDIIPISFMKKETYDKQNRRKNLGASK